MDNALARAVKSPGEARAQLAVASAVRMLSEREAAWPVNLLSKTALDLGLKGVTVDMIEKRIDRLVQNRQLIPGVATAADRTGRMGTTQEALRTEEKILGAVEEGKGKAEPIVAAADAPQRLQEAVALPLNPGHIVCGDRVAARDVDATALAVTAKGVFYYVDAARGVVGMIGADGRKRVLVSKSDEMPSPSGLTLSADQSMLFVMDSVSRFQWSFQIAKDGSLVNGEPFFRVDMPEMSWRSGVTGATVDTLGQPYFATALGIQFCEQNGRCAGIIGKPDPAAQLTSVQFGGKDLAWLYATSGGKVYRRPAKTRGVAAWTPVKPPKPPL